jgi:hypothetical protein
MADPTHTRPDTPVHLQRRAQHFFTRPPDKGRHEPVRAGVPVRLRACAACLAYDGAPVTVKNGAAVAQKVQTLFIDDLDGSAAEGTVRFGLDGTEYEIDLNAEHAQQLRDALAAYVRAGRRVSGGSRRPARGGRRGSADGLNTTEVREWAKAQGIEVKDRGRVPAELVVKFKAASGQ